MSFECCLWWQSACPDLWRVFLFSNFLLFHQRGKLLTTPGCKSSCTEVQKRALNTTIWGFLPSNAYLCKNFMQSPGAARDILLDAHYLWFSLCHEHTSDCSQQYYRHLVSSVWELFSRDTMPTSIQLHHEKQTGFVILWNWILLSHTSNCFAGL